MDAQKKMKFQNENEDTFMGFFMLIMLDRAGIISILIGAGAAYKLYANA